MKQLLISAIAMMLSVGLMAQDVKRPDSYNYNRGVEAIQNNNMDEGIEFLQKELAENPKNGYAYGWLTAVHSAKGEHGAALNLVNQCIKFVPKKDKEWKAYGHFMRASIYLNLEDTVKALADYAEAMKFNPENQGLYEERGQLYYDMKEYALGDLDYQKLCELNPGGIMGYMGLGRNAEAQGKHEEAIKQFDYAIKLANDYSLGYSFRAESLIGLKKYHEAVDDVIKALEIDRDGKAFNLLEDIIEYAFTPLVAKLKIQCTKNPNNGYWPYCLAVVYQEKGQYKKALEQYLISFEKEGNDIAAYYAACCHEELGDFQSALQYIDYAIELDSTDNDYIIQKADLLYEIGKTDEAIAQMGVYISRVPEYFGGYYRRGFFKDNTQAYDGAIEDYSMAIALVPDFAHSYLGRADMYLEKGEKELAMADYQKVVELDTVPNSYSCAPYAFFQLGREEEAVAFMDKIIEKDNENAENYYNKTCLYTLMGRKEEAIEALRISFEKGFRRFSHIDKDNDLDGLRDLPEFQHLIDEYKRIYEQEIQGEEGAVYEEKVAEIPFTKDEDMCNVKCSINGLPLHFIFDTGASDISMSSVEATFMFKNGYLQQQDVQGKQNFITADGNISEGTVINLRNVEFGGMKLTNIKASIVKNQRAPLLLGQSILKRLGKIEIDNEKRLLKITYKKKR